MTPDAPTDAELYEQFLKLFTRTLSLSFRETFDTLVSVESFKLESSEVRGIASYERGARLMCG